MRTARSFKWPLSLLPLVMVFLVAQAAATDASSPPPSPVHLATRALITKRANVTSPAPTARRLLWAAYHSISR
jgi:hypothetical protein